MKIDEASINHNVVRLVGGLLPFEMADRTDDTDNLRIMSLGYVQGVCELADELKKVLKG